MTQFIYKKKFFFFLQATGQKALFVNPGFTKRIIGLKDEESDAILQLLFKVRSKLFYDFLADAIGNKGHNRILIICRLVAYLTRSRLSSPRKMGRQNSIPMG